ncbi:uncharacterized protein LOC141802536 [Halichoeres trimaculatus]|uniref:uncharacterized protein LOC141802536 n=1 Tax=Halichoeres trimaculatus TaxID=147232 RepID=UPI003D9EB9CD
MSKVEVFREFIGKRLSAAAEEIFELFERTIAEYEEQLCRSKEENQRQQKLLEAVYNPEVRLHKAEIQQLLVNTECVHQESPSLDQGLSKLPPIKQEEEELRSRPEGEQPPGLKEEEEEVEVSMFTPDWGTGVDNSESGLNPDPHGEESGSGVKNSSTTSAGSSKQPTSLNQTEKPKKHEGKKKNFKHSCSICAKTFKRKSALIRHTFVHTGKKPFPCTVCDSSFYQRQQLKLHMRVHKREKPFSCPICDKKFLSQKFLEKHSVVHRKGTEEELRTGEQLGDEEGEEAQSSQLHEDQTEEDRETEGLKSEADGGSETHRDFNPDVGCETAGLVCDGGQSSEPQSGLFSQHPTHDQTQTKDNQYPCSCCGKTYSTMKNLKKHMMRHTMRNRFSCSFCQKSFPWRGELAMHMRVHTGERPFHCSVCKTSYRFSSSLGRHMIQHAGEKPFVCSVCGKSFWCKSTLRRHLADHTGNSSHDCSVCGQKFKHREMFKQHMTTHMSLASLDLGSGFATSGGLEEHMDVHMKNQPLVQTSRLLSV